MEHSICNKLKFSVVIITCERPDFLKSSLESVFKQALQPCDVIVVDDCSVADYKPVLEQFRDREFVYHRLQCRSGANAARNKGVELSKGDLVAFLDDDDIWHENFLEEHLNAYSTDNNVGAIICGHRILGCEAKVNINPLYLVTAEELRHGNRFSGMSGFSAKRQLLSEHPFDIDLKNGQDWDLFVRLIQADIKFVNIPKALFLYRLATPGGITAKAKKMVVDDIEPRLLSAKKHRDWLGEKYYKKRVAEQVLSFLPLKKNKLSWINKSIRLVGLKATLISLIHQIKRKLTK
ncbi:glycosyltransferase family 2 protein [Paraglaciecola sp.]|uniref:glycosyltransferase family 2 protein n=1 Tax=Paraglaciecola sp. TaxID=1920173 RepID=UPI00273E115C|nr:glycosyltransferase family 2 protein [Paraglaciecola sp.]MDP5030489.1 glycosyltransferase family 2 protein [Paraglaciecola sp.]